MGLFYLLSQVISTGQQCQPIMTQIMERGIFFVILWLALAGNLLRQFCTGQPIYADSRLGSLKRKITMNFGRNTDHCVR
jgi:hypothetical protein